MAIARDQLTAQSLGVEFLDELESLYQKALGDIKTLAEKRMVRDARKLTAEARRARIALVEYERIFRQLDRDVAEWIAEQIPAHYRKGVGVAQKGLSEIGFKQAVLAPRDLKFHGDALQLLILDTQEALLEITERWRSKLRLALRNTQLGSLTEAKINEVIGRALIAGTPQRQLSKNLLEAIADSIDDAGKIRINGRNYDAAKYARMVARTKTSEVVNAGTINRLVETGNDLVMITRHGAPDGCGFFEGRVLSISGDSSVYPPLRSLPNGGPPFHPNCRHNIAPYVHRFASKNERRRAKNINKSARGLMKRDAEYQDYEKLAKGK